MISFGPDSATVRVLTGRQGALARMGHDLEIEVTEFSIEIEDNGHVHGTFSAYSLHVIGAQGRKPGLTQLGPYEGVEIDRNIMRDVLHSATFPAVEFKADAVGENMEGVLTLHGVSSKIAVSCRRTPEDLRLSTGDFWLAQAEIDQRVFNIKPYRAMLGALQVHPVVKVIVTLPADKLEKIQLKG